MNQAEESIFVPFIYLEQRERESVIDSHTHTHTHTHTLGADGCRRLLESAPKTLLVKDSKRISDPSNVYTWVKGGLKSILSPYSVNIRES